MLFLTCLASEKKSYDPNKKKGKKVKSKVKRSSKMKQQK
jgi:hypothetical protein